MIFYSEEELGYATEARIFFEREIGPHVASMDRENRYPFALLRIRDVRGGMVAVGTNEIMRLVIQREVYKDFAKEGAKTGTLSE